MTKSRPSASAAAAAVTRPARAAIAAAVLSLLLPGCVSWRPASTAAKARSAANAQPIPPDTWSDAIRAAARPGDSESLNALAAATPPRIARFELDPKADLGTPEQRAELTQRVRDTDVVIHTVQRDAHGVLRVWNDPAADQEDFRELTMLTSGFQSTAAYLTHTEWSRLRASRAAVRAVQLELGHVESDNVLPSFTRGVVRTTNDLSDFDANTGTRLGLEAAAGTRGLILRLTGLIPSDQERAVVDALLADGWTVATLESDPFLPDPNDPSLDAASERRSILTRRAVDAELGELDLDNRAQLARYRAIADRVRANLPRAESGFAWHLGADPAAIAHAGDLRLAEHAEAAAAWVRYLSTADPASLGLDAPLADRPIVIVGFSAGGIIAPTVAARLRAEFPGRLAAVVLIGGGGDLLEIALQSELSPSSLRIDAEGAPERPAPVLAEIRAAYTLHQRLDPLRAARSLRDLPLLHVYGNNDRIVPTSAAKALNAAHGSVDRVVVRGGHGILFYILPNHAARIVRWINKHTPQPIDQ